LTVVEHTVSEFVPQDVLQVPQHQLRVGQILV
jgi:hypothetical protein